MRSTRNWPRCAGTATPRRWRNWKRGWSLSPRRSSTRPGRVSRRCPSPARSSGCSQRPSMRSAACAEAAELFAPAPNPTPAPEHDPRLGLTAEGTRAWVSDLRGWHVARGVLGHDDTGGKCVREYLICVGGTWREGHAGTMTAVSPASGAAFATVAVASPADVDDAVAAATAGWPSWAALSPFERAACCQAVAAAIDTHADGLARALTEDQGKPLAAEARDEVAELAEYFRMAAEDAIRLPGGAPPSTSASRRLLTLRVPLGAVGGISPRNWPYTYGAGLLAPALAAGYAV